MPKQMLSFFSKCLRRDINFNSFINQLWEHAYTKPADAQKYQQIWCILSLPKSLKPFLVPWVDNTEEEFHNIPSKTALSWSKATITALEPLLHAAHAGLHFLKGVSWVYFLQLNLIHFYKHKWSGGRALNCPINTIKHAKHNQSDGTLSNCYLLS